jgi:hypothetical protein
MRLGLVALALLVAAGCGSVHQRVQRRAATDVSWPPVAEQTRAQWYHGVEQAPPEPVTLSESELDDALAAAAHEAGVSLVRTHYLPLRGGTAELIVQPPDPAAVSSQVTQLLGPLGRDHRPYLVTVVNRAGDALLVLGWTPHLGGGIGEGVAWEAPGYDSGVIFGKPVMVGPPAEAPSNRLLQGGSPARDGSGWLNHQPLFGFEPGK